ncbi:hypothetical protein LA76x_3452 [Lysobacter antibioticus]|uniref:Uncharacterized protein n=1 Tax=Lysobacter antibioticus TaxID=84531 RepID=A0A0S2FDD8_LYSAN|nr:hypothetical protein LA76x_3452 [Lysobacter antibioticus]
MFALHRADVRCGRAHCGGLQKHNQAAPGRSPRLRRRGPSGRLGAGKKSGALTSAALYLSPSEIALQRWNIDGPGLHDNHANRLTSRSPHPRPRSSPNR